MTRSLREREVARCVHQTPGGTASLFSVALGIPLSQVEAALLTLQTRGLIEPEGEGWKRRFSTVRAWHREPTPGPK